ncbi:sugar transferase, partial [Desulfobacula sp.]
MFDDQKRYLQFVYITADLICLIILFFLFIPLFSSIISGGCFFSQVPSEPLSVKFIWQALFNCFIPFGSIFISIGLMVIFKGYRYIVGQNIQKICFQSIVLCVIVAGVLFISLLYYDLSLKENIYFSVISGLLLLLMLAFNRLYIFHLIKNSSSNSNLIKHLLLVGTGLKAQSISNYIEKHPECGLRVTGFITDREEEIGKTISNKKILGTIDNISNSKLVLKYYTDCVVYTKDNGDKLYEEALIKDCFIAGIDFAAAEFELHDKAIKNQHVFSERIGNFELKIVKFIYIDPLLSFFKRVSDLIISSSLIVLFLPFWVVIPIAIKLSSPGPVFFKQERIGKHGKKFILYKFRS